MSGCRERRETLPFQTIAAVTAALSTLPATPAQAQAPTAREEAEWASARAAEETSDDTWDDENLVRFVLATGGITITDAGRVAHHLPDGGVLENADAGSGIGWVGSLLGVVIRHPYWEWLAAEIHGETGGFLLDAALLDRCSGCPREDGDGGPFLFGVQLGLTVRVGVPLRWFMVEVGGGLMATVFRTRDADPRLPVDDPDRSWANGGFQSDVVGGYRLLARAAWLAAADLRLFVEYHRDAYADGVGQPRQPMPGADPYDDIEIDGLEVHSVTAGLEVGIDGMRAMDTGYFAAACAGINLAWWLAVTLADAIGGRE